MNDITFGEVVTAYYDCRRNKRNTHQQLKFEFHLENNLWNLYEDLKNETYTPSSHLFFIITKPKQRAKFATKPQSINSYFGMMRHINCYNLRKSIALRNDLNMLKYEKLA